MAQNHGPLIIDSPRRRRRHRRYVIHNKCTHDTHVKEKEKKKKKKEHIIEQNGRPFSEDRTLSEHLAITAAADQ